jgi:DNA-binding winged helix-turn-helix (wHTH) protein
MSDVSTEYLEFSFGPFRLIPERQLLLEDEKPVNRGARGLELLHALVEHSGEVVSKDELIARIWPDTCVSESNLKVQIAALRRALGEGRRGDRYTATVSGRGHRFVAPVERHGTSHDRLSRSLKDLLHIMERVREAGAGFRSLTEAVDTTTAAGCMMMQMLGSFAEFERAKRALISPVCAEYSESVYLFHFVGF